MLLPETRSNTIIRVSRVRGNFFARDRWPFVIIIIIVFLPVECRLTGGGGGGELGLAILRRRESMDDGGLLAFLTGARISLFSLQAGQIY